jgi:hypothetical protein
MSEPLIRIQGKTMVTWDVNFVILLHRCSGSLQASVYCKEFGHSVHE